MKGLLRSRTFQVSISILLAVGLLFFFLKEVRLEEIREAIAGASPEWLLAALVLSLASFVVRAIRWMWILRPVGRVPFFPAFRATAVGFAANNLPAKAGEVIRPALLARDRRLPFSALLASILLERVFDGAAVLFFFLLAAWLGHPESGAPGLIAVPAAILVALLLLVLFAVFRRPQTERFFERVSRRLPARLSGRIRGFAVTFLDGFGSLKDPKLLLLVSGGSLVLWLVINVQVATVLEAFHLDLPLPASFVVTTAAVLGLAVPTPGGLGSYQAMVQYALLRFYAVSAGPASGVAILAWALSFVPITLIGLLLLVVAPVRRGAPGEDSRVPRPEPGGREAPDGRR